jgi:3-isopropylmalate/(R)-2-methylmalate dehydratase small subunit
VELAIDEVRAIVEEVQAARGEAEVTVDLEAQSVILPGGRRFAFTAPATLREMLLQGIDEIELTLSRGAEIERFRARDRARRPWAYGVEGKA